LALLSRSRDDPRAIHADQNRQIPCINLTNVSRKTHILICANTPSQAPRLSKVSQSNISMQSAQHDIKRGPPRSVLGNLLRRRNRSPKTRSFGDKLKPIKKSTPSAVRLGKGPLPPQRALAADITRIVGTHPFLDRITHKVDYFLMLRIPSRSVVQTRSRSSCESPG
jgi:hypothetical protein